MNEQTNGWMNIQTNGWIDKQTSRLKDHRGEGHKKV